jgi:ATP synthase protein I
MSDPGKEPKPEELQDFERRLQKSLSERRGKAGPDTTEGSAAGLAFRVVSELVVGVAVCMGLGWMVDSWLGTKPWFMIGMMPLGLAAGVVNVVRLANSKQANEVLGGKGPVAPAVKDDDED